MAKLTIGETVFDIAPFKLGDLRKAAPIIDRINARGPDTKAMEDVVGLIEDFNLVLAIGTQKIDPKYDGEWFDENVGFADQTAIMKAFRELMVESGLAPKGEAKAPPRRTKAKAGASTSA